MTTSCPTCRAPIISRTWIPTITAFIEVYTCGTVIRYGEGARVLDGCAGVSLKLKREEPT